MANGRRPERALCDTADRNYEAVEGELLEERLGRGDLAAGRTPVGVGPRGQVRVRRDDVPAQRLLLELELGEHTADDRRGRLRRPGARELALRHERDTRDPCAAVAGRLADEQEGSLRPRLQVAEQPFPPNRRARPVAVEVEGRADPGT